MGKSRKPSIIGTDSSFSEVDSVNGSESQTDRGSDDSSTEAPIALAENRRVLISKIVTFGVLFGAAAVVAYFTFRYTSSAETEEFENSVSAFQEKNPSCLEAQLLCNSPTSPPYATVHWLCQRNHQGISDQCKRKV